MYINKFTIKCYATIFAFISIFNRTSGFNSRIISMRSSRLDEIPFEKIDSIDCKFLNKLCISCDLSVLFVVCISWQWYQHYTVTRTWKLSWMSVEITLTSTDRHGCGSLTVLCRLIISASAGNDWNWKESHEKSLNFLYFS